MDNIGKITSSRPRITDDKRELQRMVQAVERRRDGFEKRLQALESSEGAPLEGLTEREKGIRYALRFCLNKINDALGGDQS
jgi:hypothetical protein